MSEVILREARKLEVRLGEFLKGEKTFIEALQGSIEKIKELSFQMSKTSPGEKENEELMSLKKEAVGSFSEALKQESRAEHERSHLLESYGALIQALEDGF